MFNDNRAFTYNPSWLYTHMCSTCVNIHICIFSEIVNRRKHLCYTINASTYKKTCIRLSHFYFENIHRYRKMEVKSGVSSTLQCGKSVLGHTHIVHCCYPKLTIAYWWVTSEELPSLFILTGRFVKTLLLDTNPCAVNKEPYRGDVSLNIKSSM